MISSPKRPMLRYHGGKWRLAPWIISHFPEHRCYVEPYGGGASVLLRKNRSYAEIYNDLDQEIVSLFRIVRESGKDLKELLQMTPFSRVEFELAWFPCDDPLEQARRTVIRSFMGFASAACTLSRRPTKRTRGITSLTGFRGNSNRSGTTPAHDWANYPDNLYAIINRLQGVVIENRDALQVMAQHDSLQTLHYLDPPYLPECRDAGDDYVHEMTVEEHEKLGRFVSNLKGMVIISGYPSNLYDDMYSGWTRVEKNSLADGARKRIEVLWMKNVDLKNPKLL